MSRAPRSPGPYGFVPTATYGAPGMRVAPDYLQDYLQHCSPQTVGGQELLTNNAIAGGYSPIGPQTGLHKITQVLQATYPVPVDVCLVLYTSVGRLRFAGPGNFPAVTTGYPTGEFVDDADQSGRYTVEFGVGNARGTVETDLSSAVLYLPSVTTVSVRAAVYNLRDGQSATAHAVAMPGVQPRDQYASFTSTYYTAADQTFNDIPRQLFAREIAVSVGGSSVDGFDLHDLQAIASGKTDTDVIVGQWAGSWLDPSAPALLPPNIDKFSLAIRGTAAPSGNPQCVASISQLIRVA